MVIVEKFKGFGVKRLDGSMNWVKKRGLTKNFYR
jgi:hypothetical protein